MRDDASPKMLTSRNRQQGHLITKKLRVVCRTCNNGWMSQIENSVKEILLVGLSAESIVLSEQKIRDLASWICLKTIVAEHSDPNLASTPFVDRHAFYNQRTVPSYFRIYLGAHETASITWLYRHSATISFRQTVQPPLLDGLQRNTQTVTFILGRYVFHVLAAKVAEFMLDADLTYPGLTPIWPCDGNAIDTNSLRILNAQQLGQVMESLEQFMAIQRTSDVARVRPKAAPGVFGE